VSLQEAAAGTGRSGLHAKLSFAHAETIVPLACLLGLFGPNSKQPFSQDQQCNATTDDPPEQSSGVHQQNTDADVRLMNSCLRDSNCSYKQGEDISRECRTFGNPGEAMQSWAPPLPKPPKPRKWHGSMIAPYGANIQVNLHQCQEAQTLVSSHLLLSPACLPAQRPPACLCQLTVHWKAVLQDTAQGLAAQEGA